jgi:beta-alanine degradation protein BauB
MALTMLDKNAETKDTAPWPADIAAAFEREAKDPNPCVGTTLRSENERTRVWIIRLAPGETRHESYGAGEFKVHDLENIGDQDMVFMTVEFKDSANAPLPLPAGVRAQAAA